MHNDAPSGGFLWLTGLAVLSLASCTLPQMVGESDADRTSPASRASSPAVSQKPQAQGPASPRWVRAEISSFVGEEVAKQQLEFSAGPASVGKWLTVASAWSEKTSPQVVTSSSADGASWSKPVPITSTAGAQSYLAAARSDTKVAVLMSSWSDAPEPEFVVASTSDAKTWKTQQVDTADLRPEKIILVSGRTVLVGRDVQGRIALWGKGLGVQRLPVENGLNSRIVAACAVDNHLVVVTGRQTSDGLQYETIVSSDAGKTWHKAESGGLPRAAKINAVVAAGNGYRAVGAVHRDGAWRPASWMGTKGGKWLSQRQLSAESVARLNGSDDGSLQIKAVAHSQGGQLWATISGPKLAGGVVARQSAPDKPWEAVSGFAAGVAGPTPIGLSASTQNKAVLHLGYSGQVKHHLIGDDSKFVTEPKVMGGLTTTQWLDVSSAPGLQAAIIERDSYARVDSGWQSQTTQKYLKLNSSEPQTTKFTIPPELAGRPILVAGNRQSYTLVAGTVSEQSSSGQARQRIAIYRRSGATGPWEEAQGFAQHEGDWAVTGLWLAGANQWILTTTRSGPDGTEAITWLSPDGRSWSYQAQSASGAGAKVSGACALPDQTSYLVGSVANGSVSTTPAAWTVRDGQWQLQTPDGVPDDLTSFRRCALSGDKTLLHSRGLVSDRIWSTSDGVSLQDSWQGKPGERLESLLALTDGTVVAAGTVLNGKALAPALWVHKPGQQWSSYRIPEPGVGRAVSVVPAGGEIWVCVLPDADRSGRVSLWKMPNAREVLKVPWLALL